MMLKEIRTATTQQLTGKTHAGANVFDTPTTHSQAELAPFINVFVTSGSANNLANVVAFALSVTVQIEVTARSMDDLDLLIEQVMQELFSSAQWCDLFTDIESVSFDNNVYVESNETFMQSIIKINTTTFKSYIQQ